MTEQSPRDLLAKQSVSKTCFTCHPEQRAQFRKRSHMPLLEGKITCSDCHAPHGSSTDPLLRADSVNQLCYQCHAEKRGPFLWEHAPVVESCLNCHHPHGSNHEGLLVSPAPFLCNQCHDQPGGFGHPNDLLTRDNLAFGKRPDARITNRGCVNCHAQIHGSNHPSGARFHR
jgi:DmsE family decaheme c-type cytochrome